MKRQTVHNWIKVDELDLDTHYPRLPESMGEKLESEIINYLLSDASLIELMLAIGKNDFFEGEQLLVVKNGDRFTVIEGNRRLSAVKLLLNPEIASIYRSKVEQVIKESEFFPTEIPCLVFDNKNEILKYIGYKHISGNKTWNTLEKARYITKLKEDFFPELSLQHSSREIAKMIGSRMDYVRRVLVGYKLYDTIEKNGFYNIKGLDDTNFHFNYIADSLSRSNIENFLGIDLEEDNPLEEINYDNLQEWTNWLFNKDLPNKIIGDSDHLNNLNKVLGSSIALKAFRGGEKLSIAFELTDGINEQFNKAINDAVKQLERADSLTHKLNEFYPELIEDLNNINRIIRKIKTVKDEFELGKLDEKL